jgi:hypothetical protein
LNVSKEGVRRGRGLPRRALRAGGEIANALSSSPVLRDRILGVLGSYGRLLAPPRVPSRPCGRSHFKWSRTRRGSRRARCLTGPGPAALHLHLDGCRRAVDPRPGLHLSHAVLRRHLGPGFTLSAYAPPCAGKHRRPRSGAHYNRRVTLHFLTTPIMRMPLARWCGVACSSSPSRPSVSTSPSELQRGDTVRSRMVGVGVRPPVAALISGGAGTR